MHSKPVQARLVLYLSFLGITRIWQNTLLVAVKGKGNLPYCSKRVCVQLHVGGSESRAARMLPGTLFRARFMCMTSACEVLRLPSALGEEECVHSPSLVESHVAKLHIWGQACFSTSWFRDVLLGTFLVLSSKLPQRHWSSCPGISSTCVSFLWDITALSDPRQPFAAVLGKATLTSNTIEMRKSEGYRRLRTPSRRLGGWGPQCISPILGWLGEEDCEFKTSLGDTVRYCLKNEICPVW